jgi:transcriptional regulator with XRE-family HTH domain
MPGDSSAVNATVRRWQLTETLRQLREDAGLTIEQVINELSKGPGRWSRPKLSRIENRNQNFTMRDIEQLLDFYGVANKARANLLDLAEAANERGWWLAIRRDLPADFQPLLNLEVAMVALREYENMLVPGLLQTADYARALIAGINPGMAEDEIERRVIARVARQRVLSDDNPPTLHIILDEAVLERPVGSPAVMRTQLLHLANANDAGHIGIQIIPKEAGAHPGLEGPFWILSLPEPIPDVAYAEGVAGGMLLENQNDVRDCTLRFGILTSHALPDKASAKLITTAAERYS